MARPIRSNSLPDPRQAPLPGAEGQNSGSPGRTSSSEISAAEIQAELETILASKGFVHSERLSRFLRFTVNRALQGEAANLKEYLVGIEVFDRNGSYDPRSDPIVRVEAGRLRSKLKEFYEAEGRDDPIWIDFQKGSYAPIFKRRERPAPYGARIPFWTRAALNWRTLAVAVSLMVAGIAAYRAATLSRQNLALQRELEAARQPGPGPEFAPIWGRFFSPGAETFVVFGSPMFFANERDSFFFRYGGMNDATKLLSDPSFQRMQERFGPLSGPRYDYALMGDAIALQRLTAFFGRAGRRLAAVPAHLASWDSIKDGNIIFLGAPRTNPLLQRLPVQQDFEWGSDHNIYNRNPLPGEQKIYATPSHRDAATYAVIASFPGLRPDREMFLLSAHSAPGTLAAVEYVTRTESVREMTQKLQLGYPGKPKRYQMLLRVLADHGAPVKSEYVTHHNTVVPSEKP